MNRVLSSLERNVWHHANPNSCMKLAQISLAVFRVVTQSRIQLFATSLTYHTLLAIVPLLAVLFTLMKSFGIERFLHGLVNDVLKPMGSAGKEVGDYLFQFIGNAQTGFLGGIGLLFLLYSIFKLFNKIELSLNHLWFIEQSRSLKNQLLGYVGVIMLAVIIAVGALALNIFVHQDILQNRWVNAPIIADVVTVGLKALSIAITALMLAVLYNGAINTEINFRAAFIGGLFCAILWIPLTTGFAKLMSVSTSYSVIYSGFAGLIILLVWLNILWGLFLSGGLVVYFIQFPALLRPYGTAKLNPSEMEHYANIVVQQIIDNVNAKKGATELAALISNSGLSHRHVLNLLEPFIKQGVIVTVSQPQNAFLPAVNPEQLGTEKITAIIRGVVRSEKKEL